MSFHKSTEPDFHIARKKEMISKYGDQISKLRGHNPFSAFIIFGLVLTQITVALYMQLFPIWLVIIFAYIFGAFLNHALYVFSHESTHNLVFKKAKWNRFAGIFCDTPLVFPGAMAFRKYHLMHHAHMGDHSKDTDICSEEEAKLVGKTPLKKTLWVFLLGFSQAMRPLRLKNDDFWDKWILINLFYVISIVCLIAYAAGVNAIIYLLLSTVFGLGLHPLGGRWIAEHYQLDDSKQETYSYYGPINKIMFNIGHHTEHHDFMNIPWDNLPELRKISPEYYNNLEQHHSYSQVLKKFIFEKDIDLFRRTIRSQAE